MRSQAQNIFNEPCLQPKLLLTLGYKLQCNGSLLIGINLSLHMKSVQNYGTIVKYKNVHLNYCEIANPPELSIAKSQTGPITHLNFKLENEVDSFKSILEGFFAPESAPNPQTFSILFELAYPLF